MVRGEVPLSTLALHHRPGYDNATSSARVAFSPPSLNILRGPIPGAGHTVASKGLEYLWVRHADSDGAGAKRLVRKAIAADVVQVYEEGNLDASGIWRHHALNE